MSVDDLWDALTNAARIPRWSRGDDQEAAAAAAGLTIAAYVPGGAEG